ncbi:carboxymuconolactone decarboxylase family protein [Aureivirga sp. CE67]|uniref:carboxymuconolactone decarboxylase family protein n=1 Tax=Aureivirga sp. CE67 TaxID=1788983 RepID=UPI0018C9102D|nr:carboxymuconolactone decarboxylase family protein [Aureivirga sp. CE67]
MGQITFNDIPKGMFEHLRNIEDFSNSFTLPFSLLELIRLRVSQINACAYCVDMHHKELKAAGESELRLATLVVWEEMDVFTDQEKTTLAFAEKVTRVEKIPNSLFEKLENFYSKEEIAMLSLVVTQINTWNRLMRTFEFKAGEYEVSN